MRALDGLCNALQDSNWYVRRNAARALGRIGSADAVDALCEALKDTTASVRKEATIALGAIGDPRAIEALCRMLTDAKPAILLVVIEAMTHMGSSAIVPLCRLAIGASVRERTAATFAVQAVVAAQGSGALYALLSAEDLSAEERWKSLRLISELRANWPRFSDLRRHLANPLRFCETAARLPDESVRRGAAAILEYITLARASDNTGVAEQSILLRATKERPMEDDGTELLRGSHSETPAIIPARSRWHRLFQWMRGARKT